MSDTPKILCVELDAGLLKSRCDVLKSSGYDASSASPRLAEIMLSSQKFDLIVLSRLFRRPAYPATIEQV